MAKKNLSEYKRKYDLVRHHAWAGLGFLSIILAIRIIAPQLSDLLELILGLLIIVLIIYVGVALLLTYRYRAGLTAKQETIKQEVIIRTDEIEKEKIHADVEKERIKLEKKKAKAHVKATKKSKKK